MEDGVFANSEEGVPQGGLVSPVLSNIYLHYVLDLWFEKRFARSCAGRAYLIRYADDCVACFEHEADARAHPVLRSQRQQSGCGGIHLLRYGLVVQVAQPAQPTPLAELETLHCGHPRAAAQSTNRA